MGSKNNIEYPFDYEELGPEDVEESKKYFSPIFSKLVCLGSKKYFFYDAFVDIVSDIIKMEVRPSDTFVVTFPRSGTTWTQELVWLLQNECDFDKAKATPLSIRFPFIESGAFIKMQMSEEMSLVHQSEKFVNEVLVNDVKSLSTMPSPRLLKSHLPLSLLPPTLLDNAKVVYVARDPRDVAVSFFFHMRGLIMPKDKDFKSYWNYFIRNKTLWCPLFEHVKEAWSQRNHPNMTFIFYEELQQDLPGVARRLATFFNKQYTEEQFRALADHLKFDNFKNNSSVNMEEWKESVFSLKNFIRKGKCGGWREHFDAEMTQQAETWIADNLRDSDLRFPDVN